MSGLSVQFVRRRVNLAARTLIDGRHRSTLPEYRVWVGMLARCLNPSTSAFPRYGGRGITVCEEWQADFANFYHDMGPRPSPRHSIDRINNDGPYAPNNCRWATPDVQAKNKSKTRPSNCWTEEEVATLRRMHAEYFDFEDIARAVGRSYQTVRLRAHLLGLRRDKSLYRLSRKHSELAHILRSDGQEAFIEAIANHRAAERAKALELRLAARSTVSDAIVTISCRKDVGRLEKMRMMRLAGASLADVARVFGLSRERVRQLQAKNFAVQDNRLRKIYRTKPEHRQQHVDRLLRAWGKASEEARLDFLKKIAPATTALGLSAQEAA